MKFNNVENEKITHEGTDYWISRSMAVCCKIYHKDEDGDVSVLLVKRGSGVDNTGKLCMPCGYLDRSETLKDAAFRELFEETGITPNQVYLEPWRLDDSIKPETNPLQNITQHFVGWVDQKITNPITDETEVSEIVWKTEDEIFNMAPDLFAFDHKRVILLEM